VNCQVNSVVVKKNQGIPLDIAPGSGVVGVAVAFTLDANQCRCSVNAKHEEQVHEEVRAPADGSHLSAA
jgi:hypothetical protein